MNGRFVLRKGQLCFNLCTPQQFRPMASSYCFLQRDNSTKFRYQTQIQSALRSMAFNQTTSCDTTCSRTSAQVFLQEKGDTRPCAPRPNVPRRPQSRKPRHRSSLLSQAVHQLASHNCSQCRALTQSVHLRYLEVRFADGDCPITLKTVCGAFPLVSHG